MNVIKVDEIDGFLKKLYLRREDENFEITNQVLKIVNDVRKNGDESVRDYTLKFDNVSLDEFEVSKEEIENALKNIDVELYNSLLRAKDNIEEYHRIQIRESKFIEKDGIKIGELISTLNRVGIYVPGGTAAYPSTVLMNAVPAKLAGVKNIIMVTPPQLDGSIKDSVLVAANIAGVDKIYKIGGAQSIAALAYGTKTIEPVYKIVGPGNIFVATAKKIVSSIVGIDMIAGPSEVLILADETSNPEFIAADLIAQAEHDERAAAICITTDRNLTKRILEELDKQVKNSNRENIISKSLENYGVIIEVKDLDEAIEIANKVAPEHLEIMTRYPNDVYMKIESAGAIFLGNYSPEALGDYFAGPNHTLPTSGTAKFSSPLGVDDFIKKTSLISYEKRALENIKDNIITIANDEGLYGHANSIKIRFEEKWYEWKKNDKKYEKVWT